MSENFSSIRETGKKEMGRSPFSSTDLPWKVVFILLLAAACWLYVRRALEVYAGAPVPAGDAMEEYLQARHFFQETPGDSNIWLNRWPSLSLLLSMIWHLTGPTALVQYLLSGTALVIAAGVTGILAWKRYGPYFATTCIVLLLFQPVMIYNSARGITEPLFALLLVLLLACGYLLPKRPLLYLLPLAVIASLFVLCKEEGRYLSTYFLIIFSIYYIKTRQFSLKLLLVLFCCTAVTAFSLYCYRHYIETRNLIPIPYRIGRYFFFKEFLDGKASFNDVNCIYMLMTPFSWLKLHPPDELLSIFFKGLYNAYRTMDSMLFPGASLLVITGLVRFAFDKKLDFFFILPIAGFYIFPFALHIDNRYLLPFYCLSLPPVLQGLKQIAASPTFIRNPNFRNRLAGAVPIAFCLLALFYGHLFNQGKPPVQPKSVAYTDYIALQERIIKLLYNGKFNEASTSIEAGLAQNREFAFFYLAQGFIHATEGNKQKAYKDLETSLSLNPYQAEAYYAAYHLLWADGQQQQALSYLERSLEYRPEFPLFRKLLDNIYRSTDRTDKLELLDRKGLFNYYHQHPELRRKAISPVMLWNQLLQKHVPINGAG
jgi:hypothetical protein